MTTAARYLRITLRHLSYSTGTYTHGGPLDQHDTYATHGARRRIHALTQATNRHRTHTLNRKT